MVKYVLRFTKYADNQLNTIYTDKRAYINKLQFTEQFKNGIMSFFNMLDHQPFIMPKQEGLYLWVG